MPAAPANQRINRRRFRSGNLGLDDAVKLFDELLHHARPASVIAINQLLTAVSRAQGRGSSSSELIPSLFNRMARACSNKVAPNLHIYSILINFFCRMGRLELGFAAFGLILKTGWRVDGIVISQLLKGLCDRKCVSEAMVILLRRMPEFGCTPDAVSYSTVLKGLCNEKRVEEALELLHMMADDEGGSCPPNVVSYNSLVDGYCLAGRMKEAMKLLDDMFRVGLKPDAVSYSTLLHGYCRAGRIDDAFRLFREMLSNEVKPEIVTYSIVLHGLFQSGKFSEAKELYLNMINTYNWLFQTGELIELLFQEKTRSCISK